jgi:hypothetical protein
VLRRSLESAPPLGQSEGVINVEHWAEIRRLHLSEQLGVKTIALASDAPPKYERERAGSRVNEFEPAIRRLLTEFPDMPATVIAERIGWVQVNTAIRPHQRCSCTTITGVSHQTTDQPRVDQHRSGGRRSVSGKEVAVWRPPIAGSIPVTRRGDEWQGRWTRRCRPSLAIERGSGTRRVT